MTNAPITIDATGRPLGRLASVVAYRLRGKDKKDWNPSVLSSQKLRVTNVARLYIAPKKLRDSTRKRTSGYPGNVKSVTLEERFRKDPKRVFSETVKNMLPANTHRKRLLQLLILE